MRLEKVPKKFGTPIVRLGSLGDGGPPVGARVTDQDIDRYLQGRKARQLEEAKLADLTVATEESKLQAMRLQKEREKTGRGENTAEENMSETEKKVETAAGVAAEAVTAGVDKEAAKDLATGKKAVVIVQTGVRKEGAPAGVEGDRWSVAGGKPVKDPEGEYTFNQALKVAELQVKPAAGGGLETLNWLKDNGLLGGGKNDTLADKIMSDIAQKAADNYLNGHNGDGKGAAAEVLALRSEIQQLKGLVADANDPVKTMDKAKQIRDSLTALGIIAPSGGGDGAGGRVKSIDEIREENRHNEKMAEVENDKTFKNKIGDAVGNVAELTGRGAAKQVLDQRRAGAGEPEEHAQANFEEVECPVCKKDKVTTKIPITPETGEQFTCPRCGSIFKRNK